VLVNGYVYMSRVLFGFQICEIRKRERGTAWLFNPIILLILNSIYGMLFELFKDGMFKAATGTIRTSWFKWKMIDKDVQSFFISYLLIKKCILIIKNILFYHFFLLKYIFFYKKWRIENTVPYLSFLDLSTTFWTTQLKKIIDTTKDYIYIYQKWSFSTMILARLISLLW
jgi:hypothetical protein